MSSQGILLNWISDLTDKLNSFRSQMSPMESEYQTTWRSFQHMMYSLLAPTSGPDAFSGEASRAINNAFNSCQVKERGFQQADIPGKGQSICQTCVTGIDQAITDNSSRMTERYVEEVVGYMSVDDIVQYGREMVPNFLEIQSILSIYTTVVRPPDTQEKQEEWQTYEALCSMADQIRTATTTWDSSMSSLAHTPVPTEFLELVSEDEGRIETALDLAGKLGKALDIESLTKMGEWMEGKGTYFALLAGLLEFLSGQQHTPKALFSDLAGAGLGLLPGVDIATFALELAHDGAPLAADLQGGLADLLGFDDPALRKALDQPAEGLRAGGEKIDFGDVLNNIGGSAYDLLFGKGPEYRRVLMASVDFQRASVDLLNTADGVKNVVVNGVAISIDDGVALAGDVLPGTRGVAKTIIGGVNKVASWLGF